MSNDDFVLSRNIIDQINSPNENIHNQNLETILKTILPVEEKIYISKLGVIGKFFGADPTKAAANMAFLVFAFAILAGIIYMFRCHSKEIEKVNDFWSLIMPIITMSIGFIFGKK